MVRAASSCYMRKASILLVEIGFQETFIRAGSDSRNAVHAGRQYAAEAVNSVQVFP